MPTNIYTCIFLKSPCTLTCWLCGVFVCYSSSPQLFWHQEWVSWKMIFSGTGGAWNGFRMIQVHYIDCAFYFCFVAISECSTLTLGLGFALLWESNAADLTGGVTQTVMQAMGSGCTYRWSFTCSPSTYLLLWPIVVHGPGGWGPLWQDLQ